VLKSVMVAARYPTGATPTSRYTIGCPRCDFRHAPARGNNCSCAMRPLVVCRQYRVIHVSVATGLPTDNVYSGVAAAYTSRLWALPV